MLAFIIAIGPVLSCRFVPRRSWNLRSPPSSMRLNILHRQRPGRPRLSPIDRLLWVLLYRLWPRSLDVIVLVKPATVIQWRRQGLPVRRKSADSPRSIRQALTRYWYTCAGGKATFPERLIAHIEIRQHLFAGASDLLRVVFCVKHSRTHSIPQGTLCATRGSVYR